MYSIIDVETTGLGGRNSKITDISVFVHDGEKVIDEFHSLVNPECKIPYRISQLTGITDQMVKNAPKFYEIAKRVEEMTRNTIFIAHNVSFDYGMIRGEYKSFGYEYERERLCTVRMTKKLFPGHRSYSLGKICDDFGIQIEGRHRAYGDAKATVELFEKLLKEDEKREVINKGFDKRTIENILPPNLSLEVVNNLPNCPGVYYFHNSKEEIIYVGKSVDIRTRVLSHFRDKTRKEMKMCLETANVTFQETGNELIALLKESAEIKEYYPLYNRAQKRKKETYAVVSYTDQSGIIRLGYNQMKLVTNPLQSFYSQKAAKVFLESLCEQFELCPRYCQVEFLNGRCFNSQIGKCNGVCCGKEEIESYNHRVKEAIKSFSISNYTDLIELKGRVEGEKSFVYVENGIYKGYGYSPENINLRKEEKFQEYLLVQKHNRDVQKIINRFLK